MKVLRKLAEAVLPVVIAGLVVVAFYFLQTPKGYRFEASSGQGDYHASGWTGELGDQDVFVHTNKEPDPWVVIKLPEPRVVRRVTVKNRATWRDRVLPLVLEVPDESGAYRVVARQDTLFSTHTFEIPEPVTTDHVRLRVDGRETWLHLEQVTVD